MLATERIGAGERTLLLTHGIYGSGSNWRSIARKIVARRAEWSVLLVDLRGHGKSPHGDPPQTVMACAEDLRALGSFDALAGHSFGGKVVLAARSIMDVAQTWMLDASPGTRAMAGSSVDVLAMLEGLPRRWDRREDFVAAIVAAGQSTALAQWLAMNLTNGELRLDLAQMRALLEDYFSLDLWSALEAPRGDVEIVIADRSHSLDDARERLKTVPSHVHVHHVDADHWLHIDAPDAVVELFATRL